MLQDKHISVDDAVKGMTPITLEEMDSVKLLNRIDTKYLTDEANLVRVLEDATAAGYRALIADGEKSFPVYLIMTGLYQNYRELTDVAEETMWRCRAYDDTYKELFLREFPELYEKESLHRFIFGTYSEGNVHVRPLTKLIRDIEEDMRVVVKP